MAVFKILRGVHATTLPNGKEGMFVANSNNDTFESRSNLLRHNGEGSPPRYELVSGSEDEYDKKTGLLKSLLKKRAKAVASLEEEEKGKTKTAVKSPTSLDQLSNQQLVALAEKEGIDVGKMKKTEIIAALQG